MKTKLKELRKKNGMTQIQVARKLYLSKSAISHYESGARNIPTELLAEFAILFDTTPNDLLDFKPKSK